jgi:tetratricopeptide (TPR) repeat protein
MKNYRNDPHGFEIQLPDEWSYKAGGMLTRLMGGGRNPSFDCGRGEKFNFEIGPLSTDTSLERTEQEFSLYSADKGYEKIEFGRISVHGQRHVWARYRIPNGMWTKKYMIVLAGVEYAITATAADEPTLREREGIWDLVVGSFRLTASPRLPTASLNPVEDGGPGLATEHLYRAAFDFVERGRFSEARRVLESCLRLQPDHLRAHKELAVVLRQFGDTQGVLRHRAAVKRLDPHDRVNRYNLALLLDETGHREEAQAEAESLCALDPTNPMFRELGEKLRSRS